MSKKKKQEEQEPQNERPKLSNRPTPKAPKKSSFFKKILILVFVGVIAGAMGLAYQWISAHGVPKNTDDLGKMSQFALDSVKKGGETLSAKVKEFDWDGFKQKMESIAKSTKELWGQLTKVEENIEQRLTKERKAREENKGEVASTGGSEGGETTSAAPPKKTTYEKGLEAMREACKQYRTFRKSKKQSDLKKTRQEFLKAQRLLEQAIREVPEEKKPEVESMIMECNQYLYDCMKQEKA